MNVELTEQEEVFYANYSLIDKCDCCGDEIPIHNHHDGKNYLTITGNNIYCQKCMADSSNGKTRVS